jgi:hypothetical protein
MSGHEYTVEFRIYSNTLAPHEITLDLGLEPCRMRTENSPGPRGWNQCGMWAYDGGGENRSSWDSLEEGLTHVLDKLWAHRDAIAGYKRSAELVWWCGHFQYSFDGGPRLSPSLLRRLGEFGAELYIDNYHSIDTSEELPS